MHSCEITSVHLYKMKSHKNRWVYGCSCNLVHSLCVLSCQIPWPTKGHFGQQTPRPHHVPPQQQHPVSSLCLTLGSPGSAVLWPLLPGCCEWELCCVLFLLPLTICRPCLLHTPILLCQAWLLAAALKHGEVLGKWSCMVSLQVACSWGSAAPRAPHCAGSQVPRKAEPGPH